AVIRGELGHHDQLRSPGARGSAALGGPALQHLPRRALASGPSGWPVLFTPSQCGYRGVVIEQTVTPVTHDLGGFKVHRALPSKQRTMVGPFIFVEDRKSTRLNSSHEWISYAVFCLK